MADDTATAHTPARAKTTSSKPKTRPRPVKAAPAETVDLPAMHPVTTTVRRKMVEIQPGVFTQVDELVPID